MAESGRRGRAGYIGLDQALSSTTGFLLSALSLRLLPSTGFALFTLFYSAYLLVGLLIRAATGDVANAATGDRVGRARRAGFVAGTLGLLVAAPVGLAGLVTGSATVLTGAAILPGLVLQDSLRMAAIATYRPRIAVLLDGCWLGCFGATGAAGVAVAAGGHPVSLPTILAVWGLGAYLSSAACLLRHPELVPLPCRPLRWLTRHRSAAIPFAGEAFMQNGLNAATSYAVAAVAGLGQLALFKAAMLALGPASLLLQAGGAFLVSEAVRERSDVHRLVRTSTAVLCGLTAAWLAAVLVAPEGVLAWLFGDTAVRARPLVPYLGICVGLTAAIQARQSAIRALQRPALAFWTRTAGAVCANVAVVAGATLGGGAGAARCGAAGYLLALLVSQRGIGAASGAPGPAHRVPAVRDGVRS